VSRPDRPRRHVGLQAKVLAVLLAIAGVPLVVSALVIERVGRVAQNFASNEAAQMRPYLDRSADAYRALIEATTELYAEIAEDAAATTASAGALEPGPALDRTLARILADEPRLAALAVVRDGQVLARRERPAHAPSVDAQRVIGLEQPIPGTGAALELQFQPQDWQAELSRLGERRRYLRQVETVRSSLPGSYRVSFLLLVGAVVVVVTLSGILVSRRLTGRIGHLVSATQRVAAGDLSVRVELAGRDELAQLGRVFNRMVEDLEHDREQINYLQRVSAWQDVARKLAHEIKNPLTPIQLAVQQVASSYPGDDARFRRLLSDTQEIVGEEIANLGRLVDAFRDLGSLPPVEPRPLDLATVVGDLETEPALLDHLRLEPPDRPVRVEGDRLLLRRLLHNLVENGIQASDGGAVTVAWLADEDAGKAIVTIDDQGPGITEAQRQRIFEPYITTKTTGTGLGLTISKKIALDHRGALDLAADPAPTGGARFVLTLPLAG
jgi:two-component system, NtrC family, nitrogen regulation sensor histidine kinase NtrY